MRFSKVFMAKVLPLISLQKMAWTYVAFKNVVFRGLRKFDYALELTRNL